ncbi:lipid-transfer protein [Variovorax robiniae]|uniref:propanoyl-CoA C-acyltransferase n=1 Tax=Variovorax robiniae TaxID=1836199 RepID=A0ABU8XFY3_9BURK
MSKKVYVAGVGMIPFQKPGASGTYVEMGSAAVRRALEDAGIEYNKIQVAYCGYVHGPSTSGQSALYEVGITGIPVINVNNNCASGSSALYLARQAVQHGVAECVLALGFEQMRPGASDAGASIWNDRPPSLGTARKVTEQLADDLSELPLALRVFTAAGREHMQRYGTKLETFAKIRAKASQHAARNPLALFRKLVTTEQVMAEQAMWPGLMTRLMACPPTCGAAAALIVSETFAKKHNLRTDVHIVAQSMVTDAPGSYEPLSMIRVVGADMTRRAAQDVYEQAGVGPDDIKVCELHDCFAQNELITCEGLGFCDEGEGERFVQAGDNTYGGKVVINPSGGLLSKGHPLGATGLAQCYELTHQMRGTADARQVESARFALQHNLGLGGAGVVTLYARS